MIDVVMPQMGESIVEGTLTRWLKKPGEQVERDEPLFEISTDKVDTEIPVAGAGVLEDVLVEEGKTVAINTVVARIDEGAAEQRGDRRGPLRRNRQHRRRRRRRAPPLQQKEQATAPEPAGAGAVSVRSRAAARTGGGTASAEEPTGPLSPVVRKMAREHNIDLRQIRGTGAGGRITKADVEAYHGRSGRSGANIRSLCRRLPGPTHHDLPRRRPPRPRRSRPPPPLRGRAGRLRSLARKLPGRASNR